MTAGTEPTTLSDEHLAILRAIGRQRQFPASDVLFVEGDSSDYLVLIDRGIVKITTSAETGYTSLLAIRGAGELVGEFGCLDGGLRSGTVTAVTGIDATMITTARFEKTLASHPKLVFELLQIMVGRVREADRRRLEFGAYPAVDRVGRVLLDLARRHGRPVEDSPGAVMLPALQRDLAGAAGSSRETVARSLRKLQNAGVIKSGRGQVLVTDLELLAALVTESTQPTDR